MKKNKLLIVGGGVGDIPIIEAAKKLGFFVITLSTRSESIAHKYSDEHINADYTNKDEVLSIVKKENIKNICPCTNDFAAITCSYVAENLNLRGHDNYQNALLLHKKDKFREFTNTNNILAPKAKIFKDIQSALIFLKQIDYDIIVKPSDSTSGKGISKIQSSETEITKQNKLLDAFHTSTIHTILLEEYIEGTNHGFSSLIQNEKIIFYFVDNEHYYLNKYMVSGASTATGIQSKTIELLHQEIEKIASILHLKDGLFHVQFIIQNNIPYIIEVCRRIPGDLYVKLVQYATSVDYSSCIVKAFTGMHIDATKLKKENNLITRHCIMSEKRGLAKRIIYDKRIEYYIIEKVVLFNEYDKVDDILNQKFGIVFIQYDNITHMQTRVNTLNSMIHLEVV